MISYLIYSAISMGILILFYYAILFKEKTFHINRVFLLFSLIFSLIIPLIPVGISGPQITFFQNDKTDDILTSDTPFTIVTDANMPEFEENPVYENEENSASTYELFILLLTGFYASGVLFLFIRLLRIEHMIQLKIRRNPGILHEGHEVVLLNENVVPHTFLNTIFVSKKQYVKGEIDNRVFLHELAHVKQKHTIDILFVEILKIFYWFNPVIYLYKKAILINHEFLADESVIREGISVSDYQKMILKTLLNRPSHALASSLTFGLIKKRFFMMTQSNNKTRAIMKIASLIPLFVALSLLLGCESIPADGESTFKELTIELTNSEIIRLNSEEMDISNLEEKLEEYSQKYDLRFVVKNHPDTRSELVSKLHRLIHEYDTQDNISEQSQLQIYINKESEIIVDGETHSLDELNEVLADRMKESLEIINFRVDRNAEFGTITDVQRLLRIHGILRIIYSSVRESNETGSMQYSDQTLTLPPAPPSPETRFESSTEGAQNRTAPAPPVLTESKNLLTIRLNAQGMMLVNDQPENVSGIKLRVKDFLGNYGDDPNLSVSPQEAILVIRHDRHLAYESYIEILDEIMSAYNELRNDYAMERFGVSYSSIKEESDLYRQIQNAYPKQIAIAETGN
ncbi:MAG: hypothetical protein EA359_09915 [Balneolaceae bacterium]|nr:MAG: hypothetical protein EA359_09915 [Balneolaceae bacterium]